MGSAFYIGPFLNGLKPRRFFAATKAMVDKEASQTSGGLQYNPDWRKNTKSKV